MQQQTILIADDETHILNVLMLKFQNAGFKVITAEDGADAYELSLAHKPDMIITDYQMPMLSGVELCYKLQSDPLTRDIPAILLTARGFTISEDDMNLANIKHVIPKPFSPREVLACVMEHLNEKIISMS